MQVALACGLDEELEDFWRGLDEIDGGNPPPIVTHLSAEGAELGRWFHEYGDPAAWVHLLESREGPKHADILFAHAGTLPIHERDDSPERDHAGSMARSTLTRLFFKKLKCDADRPCTRRLYLDFSDALLHEQSRRRFESPRVQFIKFLIDHVDQAIADGSGETIGDRIVYGSDFWMNVMEGDPRTYLQSHIDAFQHGGLEPYATRYFSANAMKLYGLEPGGRLHAKACEQFSTHPPDRRPRWLVCASAVP